MLTYEEKKRIIHDSLTDEQKRKKAIWEDSSNPLDMRLEAYEPIFDVEPAEDWMIEEIMEELPVNEDLEEILGVMYDDNLSLEENAYVFIELKELGLTDYSNFYDIFKPLPRGEELKNMLGSKYSDNLSEKENLKLLIEITREGI